MRASSTLGMTCVLVFATMVATPAADAANGKAAKAQRAAPVVAVVPPRPPVHPTVAAKSLAQRAQPAVALPLPPPTAPRPSATAERRPAAPMTGLFLVNAKGARSQPVLLEIHRTQTKETKAK